MVAVIARSVRGLEWVTADEIAARFPRAGRAGLAPRQVRFSLPAPDGRLLDLKTADDVFVEVGQIGDVGTTKDVPVRLARQLAELDWETPRKQLSMVRPLPRAGRPVRFDVVASLDGRRRYNRYAVEGAAGTALAARLDGEFAERDPKTGVRGAVSLTVRLFLTGPVATAALRLTEAPLHRRSYKQDTGRGTLHPPVAAALARLAQPAGGQAVSDPFCGDGTLPIECARLVPAAQVCAADLNLDRLHNTRANAERAGVGLAIVRADAGRLPFRPGSIDVVLTNPPWQRTVERTGSLARSPHRFLWELQHVLSETGRVGLIVDDELDLPVWLERLGFATALDQRIRLAGRVSRILLCAPEPRPAPPLPRRLRRWHREAVTAGLISSGGF